MMLTELEGAVLSEIHHRDRRTAFQVRKSFEESPSTEWSGSSGAVYPAIRRLTERGLIRSELLPTARRASRLTVTSEGVEALEEWATNVFRALGVGLDPFRLRSGVWAFLSPKRRRDFLEELKGAIETHLTQGDAVRDLDDAEKPRAEWARLLQRARHQWLEQEIARLEG